MQVQSRLNRTMLKAAARAHFKDLRNQSLTSEREDWSIAIANNLLKADIWEGTYYHLFLSISEQREVDTENILNILFAKNKEIVIAKSDFEKGEMTHYLLTENTRIKKNKWNIPEPVDGIEVPTSKIDVVFIPLLAYDKKGNRVGYGKGFYDRFLKETDCIKIGLSFFEPIDTIDDLLPNDIPLDYCITPKSVHRF